MPDLGDFHPSWASYKKRLAVAVALFLGYIPGVAAIAIPLQRITGSDVWVPAVASGWMVAWAVAVVRLNSFRCPRCGNVFHVRGLYGNPFARNCLHCGLAKWSDPS
jgi:predicted RNA-binding Zn-ribbon protein involved in translation (DUF1610 family)